MIFLKNSTKKFKRKGEYLVGKLTDEQIKMIDKIYELGKVDALNNVLNGVVARDYQTLCASIAYISKRFVFGADTGLGKTLMIAMYLKIHKMKSTVDKFIIATTNSSVDQIKTEIESATGLSILRLPGDAESLLVAISDPNFFDYDGYIVANSAFSKSIEFARYFNYVRKNINVFIFDESMEAANPNSIIHNSVKYWIKDCEYRVLCNATIIERSIEQLYYQFDLLDPELLPPLEQLKRQHEVYKKVNGKSRLEKIVGVDSLLASLRYHYINISRFEKGMKMEYEDYLIPVFPTDIQQRIATGYNYEYALFSPTTQKETSAIPFTRSGVPALDALMKTTKVAMKDGPVVIYAEPVACKEIIIRELKEEFADISIAVIDGDPNTNKEAIRQSFNRGNIDVLIINIPESLNLYAGRSIIFFTLPSKHYQARGRIERSISDTHVIKFYYIIYMFYLQLNYVRGTFVRDEMTLDNAQNRGIVTARNLSKKLNELESKGYYSRNFEMFKV